MDWERVELGGGGEIGWVPEGGVGTVAPTLLCCMVFEKIAIINAYMTIDMSLHRLCADTREGSGGNSRGN